MNELLSTQIQSLVDVRNCKVKLFQKQVDELFVECERDIERAILDAGHRPCEKCRMTGAIERLDSGVMKRFGIKPWDVCAECVGGKHNKRGRGFI